MKTYAWMSFASEEGFQGCAVLEVPDYAKVLPPREMLAIMFARSWEYGVNVRGSSVQTTIINMPVPPPPELLNHRISDKEELKRLEEQWHDAAVASGVPKVNWGPE